MSHPDLVRGAHRMMIDAARANLTRELVEVQRAVAQALTDLQRPEGPVVFSSSMRALAATAAEVGRYAAELNSLQEVKSLIDRATGTP